MKSPRPPFPAVPLAALILAVLPLGDLRADYERQYTSGHADLRVVFRTGALLSQYRFAPGAVIDGVTVPAGQPAAFYEAAPNTITTVAGEDAKLIADDAIPYLGVGAGAPIWVLPQVNNLNLPFLGVSTENLEPGVWTNITLALVGYNGPGNFALWQSSPFGGASVKWRTNDGLTTGDSFVFGAGTHDHYNWGFTAEGIYNLTIRASATSAETGVLTHTDTYRFRVGPPTVVPEPTSLVLAAVGGAGLAAAGRRRRRRLISRRGPT